MPTIKPPETTREKILLAAFGEFYANGFQSGSLNRIIEAAGLTKGAVFHHFKNKTELGYAVLEEIIETFQDQRWFRPIVGSEDPVTDLKTSLERVLEEEFSEAESHMLMNGCPLNNLAQEMSPLDEGFHIRIAKIYRDWRETIEKAFVRGMDAGTVRQEVSPKDVAAFVVAAHVGIFSTAKHSRSEEVTAGAANGLFQYLDFLRP